MAWTIDGIPFSWIRSNEKSVAWQRDPVLDIQSGLGTGATHVNVLGFGPETINDEIIAEPAAGSAIQGRNGTLVTVSNGSASWSAYLKAKLYPLMDSTETTGPGWQGSIELVRPRRS